MATEATTKAADPKASPVPATGAPAAAGAANTTAPEPVQVRFKLELLATIKTAQQQNGLRHQDYQRYRQYCTRRIRRLRQSLGLLHPRKEFKKRPIEAKHVTDAKVLQLPLLTAERAWAYAMQLKADVVEEKDNTRLKFHLLRRLKKAAKSAADLEQLCSTCGDARAQLEAEAYSTWMQANVLFEQNQFPKALQKFTHSKTVYESLGKSVSRGTQLLCEERVASIEPAIKYCKMIIAQTGGGSKAASEAAAIAGSAGVASADSILRAKLEHVLDETRKEQAKNLERVSWQGAQWTVESEKLRVKFVEIKELVAKFAKKEEKSAADMKAASSPRVAKGAAPPGGADAKADAKDVKAGGSAGAEESDSDNEGDGDNPNTLYVHLLSCYDEAVNLIRDELKELKRGGETTHSKEKEATLNALRAYVAFNKLRATGDRNLIMAEHIARSYRNQIADDARLKEEAAAAAAAAAANKQAKKLTKKQKADAKKAAADSKATDSKDAKSGAPAASGSSAGATTAATASASTAAASAAAKKAAAAAAALKQKKRVKPDDVVVLYEKLIQNMTELAELVTADKPLLAQLQARAAAYKAFRCLYLAESYRAISKWAEAYALYGRTQQLVAAATPLLTAALGAAAAAGDLSGLAEVNRLAGSAQAVVHATGVLEQSDKARASKLAAATAALGGDAADSKAKEKAEKAAAKKAASRPLLDRLNAFDAGDASALHNLVSFPPNFQAVPCKPTLFDLAFNGVAYPNIDARVKAKPTAPANAPAPSSSKGFLSRIFGR